MKPLVLTILALALAGCAFSPEWRVWQKKIDPRLADKPTEQTEAERQAAAYIRDRSAVPEPDAVQQVAVIHSVAVPLAASLGEPQKPASADKDRVIADLQAGLRAEQRKSEAWRAFARKYAYKEVDGTGIDLAKPTALLGVAAVVAACIFLPGFLTVVLFVIRRLRGTLQQVAQGVEEFAVEHPAQAKELKEYLSSALDKPAKAVIRREKQHIDRSNIEELMRQRLAPAANMPPP